MATPIVVRSGDSIWEIAKRALQEENHGKTPKRADIVARTQEIIDLNRSQEITVDPSSGVNAEAAKAFMQRKFNEHNQWQLYPGVRLFVPGGMQDYTGPRESGDVIARPFKPLPFTPAFLTSPPTETTVGTSAESIASVMQESAVEVVAPVAPPITPSVTPAPEPVVAVAPAPAVAALPSAPKAVLPATPTPQPITKESNLTKDWSDFVGSLSKQTLTSPGRVYEVVPIYTLEGSLVALKGKGNQILLREIEALAMTHSTLHISPARAEGLLFDTASGYRIREGRYEGIDAQAFRDASTEELELFVRCVSSYMLRDQKMDRITSSYRPLFDYVFPEDGEFKLQRHEEFPDTFWTLCAQQEAPAYRTMLIALADYGLQCLETEMKKPEAISPWAGRSSKSALIEILADRVPDSMLRVAYPEAQFSYTLSDSVAAQP